MIHAKTANFIPRIRATFVALVIVLPTLAAAGPKEDFARMGLDHRYPGFLELEQMRSNLATIQSRLDLALRGAGGDFGAFLAASPTDLRLFSDFFYDYRMHRMKFWTETSMEMARGVNQEYRGMATSPTFAEIEEKYSALEAELSKVVYLEDLEYTRDRRSRYHRAKKEIGKFTNNIGRAHRRLLVDFRSYAKQVYTNNSAIRSAAVRVFHNYIGPMTPDIQGFVDQRVFELIEANQNPFPTMDRIVTASMLAKFGRVSDNIAAKMPPLGPGQYNVIVAPHGSTVEVAMIASRIATRLPPGRKAAVILAPYQLMPDTPEGFQRALAMDRNPYFIGVRAGFSPHAARYKAVTGLDDSPLFSTQIEEARALGITDFILLGEGRRPPTGGLTGINVDTMRMLSVLSKRDRGDSMKMTLVSASLPNQATWLGYRPFDQMRIQVEHSFSGAQLQELNKDPLLMAAGIDSMWSIRAAEGIRRNNIGGIPPENVFVKSLAGRLQSALNSCKLVP